MTLLRLILVVGWLALAAIGCSNGESLEGNRYESVGGADYIQFLSDGRFETPLESSVIEGDYAVEDDGRIRLAIELLGIRQVAYGVKDGSDGILITFDENNVQRYFEEGDNRIQEALVPSKTLLQASARFCANSRCMGILPSEKTIELTDVGVVVNGDYKLSFKDMLELELVDVRRNPRFGVAVKMSPAYERAVLFGGWTEYRFASKDHRNRFYASLGRALNEWHAEYGVREFSVTEVAIANVQRNSPLPVEQRRPRIQEESSSGRLADIVGFWRHESDEGYIVFRRDGTTDMYEKGALQMSARYSVISEDRISVEFKEDDGSIAREEVPISVTGDRLSITGDSFRRVSESEFREASASGAPDMNAKTQIQRGLSQAAMFKAAVTEAYLNSQKFPVNNTEAGLASNPMTTEPFISDLRVTDGGVIEIVFGSNADPAIAGQSVELRPKRMQNSVLWECVVDLSISAYAPHSCVVADQAVPTRRR